MGISEVDCEATAREAASLPLALGGLGLKSASGTHLTRFTWCRSAIQVLLVTSSPNWRAFQWDKA